MALEHVKLEKTTVFGWTKPTKDCWWFMANDAVSEGWESMDIRKFLHSFNRNVEICYKYLFTSHLIDLDSDRIYIIRFDNSLKLWDVVNAGNENVPVTAEERKDIFTWPTFKNTLMRLHIMLSQRLETLEKVIQPHLTDPELVEIDTPKLEAIDHFLRDDLLRKNLRLGKYRKSFK